jgi:hypothetical protein
MGEFDNPLGTIDSSFRRFLWAYVDGELVCTIDYCEQTKSAYLLHAWAGHSDVSRILCSTTIRTIERSAECYFSS